MQPGSCRLRAHRARIAVWVVLILRLGSRWMIRETGAGRGGEVREGGQLRVGQTGLAVLFGEASARWPQGAMRASSRRWTRQGWNAAQASQTVGGRARFLVVFLCGGGAAGAPRPRNWPMKTPLDGRSTCAGRVGGERRSRRWCARKHDGPKKIKFRQGHAPAWTGRRARPEATGGPTCWRPGRSLRGGRLSELGNERGKGARLARRPGNAL